MLGLSRLFPFSFVLFLSMLPYSPIPFSRKFYLEFLNARASGSACWSLKHLSENFHTTTRLWFNLTLFPTWTLHYDGTLTFTGIPSISQGSARDRVIPMLIGSDLWIWSRPDLVESWSGSTRRFGRQKRWQKWGSADTQSSLYTEQHRESHGIFKSLISLNS